MFHFQCLLSELWTTDDRPAVEMVGLEMVFDSVVASVKGHMNYKNIYYTCKKASGVELCRTFIPYSCIFHSKPVLTYHINYSTPKSQSFGHFCQVCLQMLKEYTALNGNLAIQPWHYLLTDCIGTVRPCI